MFILQKLRSLTTLAAIGITLLFAWKILRAPQEQPRRPHRRVATSPSNTSSRSRPGPGALASTDACTSSADSRAHEAINQLFQPANVLFIIIWWWTHKWCNFFEPLSLISCSLFLQLTLEQLVRHKLNEGRRVFYKPTALLLFTSDLQSNTSIDGCSIFRSHVDYLVWF
jgi:hypothetical protein